MQYRMTFAPACLLAFLLLGTGVQPLAQEPADNLPVLDQSLPITVPDTANGLMTEASAWSETQQQWQTRQARVQTQLQRLQASHDDLQAHVLALDGSIQIYRVLQQQRASLPDIQRIPGLSEAIADIRLRQFDLSQQQRDLPPEATARAEAIEHLQSELQAALDTAVALQQSQGELVAISDQLRTALKDELFWVPSNPPLNLAWWQALPQRLFEHPQSALQRLQVLPAWSALGLGQLTLSALFLVTALLAYWARPRLQARLRALNARLEGWHEWLSGPTDLVPGPSSEAFLNNPVPSPRVTPSALGILALQSAPLSLLMMAVGILLATPQPEEVMSLGPALVALAFSLFVVQFLRRLLKSRTFSAQHFGWSDSLRLTLLNFVQRFTWVLLPTTVILALAQQQALTLTQDTLGVLVVIASGLAFAVMFYRILRQLPALQSSVAAFWALNLVLVLLPLTLVFLTLSGYYYSSLQLTARVLATFYILTAWVIASVTVNQGMALATAAMKRRLDEEEAQTAQALASQTQGELPLVTTDNKNRIDLDKVNQQSRRLAHFLLLITLGGLLFWAWADLISVLGTLEGWGPWAGTAMDYILPVNIIDLMTALVILVLTFFLAANLPGLLEMIILSRLRVQQDSAYAITSLMNYCITGTGIVLALATLGVSWDRLQWLVAALSVGLGFGLQEIFANFVSGLIILFERPIRIGDVVTLGNLSGRVSHIRMRATTITDFDRKDIVVPNKTFVTGQLVNWSLTDTVTRVTIKIGVAYGSDLERTRELLHEAARINTRVLPEPEPQVLFLDFEASALAHELRIHVRELGDRNPAIDEINRFLDNAFREAGIEVAFQQVDIRLRNSEGLDQLVEQRAIRPSDSA